MRLSHDSQGGYDSGTPDKVPDLIQFSPTDPLSLKKASPPTKQVTGQQRNRSKSTDSFNMDPQVIEFHYYAICVMALHMFKYYCTGLDTRYTLNIR